MRTLRTIFASALLAFAVASTAHAQCIISPTPCIFPPPSCTYFYLGQFATYTGGHQFGLTDLENSTDCAPLPASGVTTTYVVHASYNGHWIPNGGPNNLVGGPAVLTFNITGGPPGNPTPYALEMLALDLAPFAPGVRVRESPTHPSIGQATVQDAQLPNQYRVDSFFDVFTELTLDDGQTWLPSSDQLHLLMIPAPPLPAQPTTWGALKVTYR